MIVRFRLGNITETRPVHGKLDHHVSGWRKRDGFKQLHVSVKFTKYGNTLFRPVPTTVFLEICSNKTGWSEVSQMVFSMLLKKHIN